MRTLFICSVFLAIASPFTAQQKALDFSKYNEGYYVDNNGNKIFGILRYVKGNNARIEYKKTEDAKREKISPSSALGFVLKDSTRFIRVDGDFNVKVGVWNIQITDDFIQVLETGKVSLYIHHSLSGDGDPQFPGVNHYQNYVVKTDSSRGYIGLHPNTRKRRKAIEDRFRGNEELMEILCRKSDKEVREGIKEYNAKYSGTSKSEGSGQ